MATTIQNPVRWVALGIVLLVLLPATVVLGSRLGKDPADIRSVVVGKPAKPFEVTTLDGQKVRSEDLVGRAYVVNVWASWCVPCRKEHGALRAFHEKYRDQGVELLGVLYNDKPAAARAYMKELGGDWPIVTDPKYRLITDFGVRGPPETFVVDPNGIITVKFTGAVNYQVLEDAMTDIGLTP